jgi:hypothetical protein
VFVTDLSVVYIKLNMYVFMYNMVLIYSRTYMYIHNTVYSYLILSCLVLSCLILSCLVLSSLLSLMSTLEERIRDLKAEIAEYRQEYANSSPEEKKELRPLITARGNNLTALLQQQSQEAQSQAQSQGE